MTAWLYGSGKFLPQCFAFSSNACAVANYRWFVDLSKYWRKNPMSVMSEMNSSVIQGFTDENQQENNKIEPSRPLKNKENSNLCKTRKLPAKVNATRHHLNSPPFSKEVYNHFISSFKYGEPAFPTTTELRELEFQTSNGTSHRKRFRRILAGLEVRVVQGALVLSPNLEEDVLVYKRSGKILVAREDVDKVIRRAHLWGNNETNEDGIDERTCKHHNVGQTLAILGKVFTVNKREFGIDRGHVRSVIMRCASCKKGCSTNNEVKLKKLSTTNENMNQQSFAKAFDSSGQVENDYDITELEKARFPSMVAHVPDKLCIWYDRKSIADATNRFEKLMMVLSEMKGEMALSAKGDAQAKQRLEAKLYCAQLLINEHAKTIQKSLILEDDSPKIFRNELLELKQEYKQTDQEGIFSSDITDMLAHVKSHKLVISPLIVREIEDFVRVETEKTQSSEHKTR